MKRTVSYLIIIALILTGCNEVKSPGSIGATPTPTASDGTTNQMSTAPAASIEPEPTPTPLPTATSSPAPIVYRATLSAIGDVLIHNRVYQEAALPDGTYNFKPMFAQVKDMLQQSDLLIANEESINGGTELGLSSYPQFNSPHEVSDALLDAGVDLVTLANNHSMDKREKGIQSATAYLDKIGLPYTGAFRSQEDRDRIRTLTKQGITFAFLAYTYGTNGIPIPPDKPYLVNLLDENLMKSDIEQARKLADVVVVSTHWGIENTTLPSESQTALAQKITDWGADIVLGTHPHVIQPFSWLSRRDGGKTLVMYSLGNFLSSQTEILQRIGGIGQIEVIKTVVNGASSIELQEPKLIPTYMQYENYANFRVVPFKDLDAKKRYEIEPYWNVIKKQLVQQLAVMKWIE